MSSNLRLLIHFSDIPQAERLKNIRVTVIAAKLELAAVGSLAFAYLLIKRKRMDYRPYTFSLSADYPAVNGGVYIGVYVNVLCRRVRPTFF